MAINVIPVSINLTRRTYEEANAMAKDREMSVSALVRSLINQEFAITNNNQQEGTRAK